ncbi:dihydrouridine synthase [Sodiomyces alkalinus F11]|uniref:tRNA-dihydrouridine(47) synthase [NAD(P)(+)] n=1 Tax=Sodiomyces alkalinus (strain CBS 110278 / VKM F-3762 / F11) TaxID=1314773 RepID=A0A3N2PZA0_SODAK|nr:dihydrouridine synthase [Sodiomyces alkalinus F11]ROT39675.1 dihydrouridine synthase [Sodiomyces alkalinus F11]
MGDRTSPGLDESSGERATKRLKVDDSSASQPSGAEAAAPAIPDGGSVNGLSKKPSEPAAPESGAPAAGGAEITMTDAPRASEHLTAQPVSSGTEVAQTNATEPSKDARDRGGVAPVKAEFYRYLIRREPQDVGVDDDAAEGRTQGNAGDERSHDARDKRSNREKKPRGQNKERTFGHFDDAIRLCNTRAFSSEFSPRECKFGDRCKMSHHLRKYLEEGRRADVECFGGKCPVFEQCGRCPSGWKCRFVRSHMKEVEREDGRKELVLLGGATTPTAEGAEPEPGDEQRPGVVNTVDSATKIDLNRRRVDMSELDKYITWLNAEAKTTDAIHQRRKKNQQQQQDESSELQDLRAQYTEPPLKPSEKRKLYFGRDTPVLAPLTTQGNLPFRRLCVDLGAQLTYSEMAMGLPLIQGNKTDWALLRAHESEIAPPTLDASRSSSVVQGYDNSQDIRFGAQIAAHQPWIAIKATDCLRRFVPHLRVIDLNCGCPIDMVYKSGGGSGLLEAHGKLERMIRGMNAVSGAIPVTAKIRMGIKTNRPNATTVLSKLAFGARETRDRLGAPGCAAVTLHGRSREQRYTKRADWAYIAECAALIRSYNDEAGALADTVREPDASSLPAAKGGKMFFLGNGDCYSHVDYFRHIDEARVDSVMIGRGALVKPWLFEEIEKGQYLDKSASERLTYIETFVRYGLEAWGSDELGIGFTRRFLLEWLSFTHRYVPIGILEHLPPSLNDRPPLYRGRNDLETLLASNNYKDWIKITEMFLGPCHPGFTFQPKHKSHAYEAEG